MTESDNSKIRRDWNAMIYLAGENNLADECVFALKELKRARSRKTGRKATDEAVDARVKVVAQLDAGGLGGNEVRYLLKRGGGDRDGELNRNEITRIDTTETTYRGVLKDFISSSILIRGRAKHYLLVLSGHGNGLISDFLSRDIDTPDKLSIPKIRWVLREVKKDFIEKFGQPEDDDEDFKIDILGLDSCMMSMAEIGYELRHYVKYMVGAEGFEPNSGWPYERILSDLLTDSDIEPEAFAVQIVDRYVRYYTDFLPAARSVDLSACDLSRFDELASAIKELADVLYDKIKEPDLDSDSKPNSDPESNSRSETIRQIVLAHWEAQSYKDDQYVDLYDFCDLLDRGPDENPERPKTGSVVMKDAKVDEDIVTACRKIKRILTGNGKNGGDPNVDKPMILRSRHSGPAVQYSHGLSVYFPWSNVIDSYEDLEFATDTNWKRFLDKYVEVTRRCKRPCPTEMESGQVVEGQLFFNPVIAGFDFLLSENKNAPTVNRFLSNKVGGMKNPAIDHVVCKYPGEKELEEDEIEEKAEPPESKGTQSTQEKPTTETGETSVEPGEEPSVAGSGEPGIRRARKK
ncbi:MAG TPA: clostripain-related cysteine peptidase [Pyrinomonadaceae bacterium]|nr:clostripain-related cysteine peptidase [Pyrinomonadaceae bacterium]